MSRKTLAVRNLPGALCYGGGVLRILIQPRGVALEAAEGGERLLDLVDDQCIGGVALACRGARCGICRLRVVRGVDCFAPPAAAERETLGALGAGADERLACQLRLAPDASGEVELHLLSAPPVGG